MLKSPKLKTHMTNLKFKNKFTNQHWCAKPTHVFHMVCKSKQPCPSSHMRVGWLTSNVIALFLMKWT
jgi:hypothetical protein